jgi:hypothetical protein
MLKKKMVGGKKAVGALPEVKEFRIDAGSHFFGPNDRDRTQIYIAFRLAIESRFQPAEMRFLFADNAAGLNGLKGAYPRFLAGTHGFLTGNELLKQHGDFGCASLSLIVC